METTTSFMTMVASMFTAIGDGIEIFTTAPLSYFVALGFAGAAVGIARKLVPSKRAR